RHPRTRQGWHHEPQDRTHHQGEQLMDRTFTRGIPANEHLPKAAHKLADKIRDLEAKHREALSAYTQYNPNTREGRSAENAARDADREALAQAVLDGTALLPDKHHREFLQERAKA